MSFPRKWESRLVPAPDKGIRGQVPTGTHLKPWIPAFAGNPGFLLEFIPGKTGAGMTTWK